MINKIIILLAIAGTPSCNGQASERFSYFASAFNLNQVPGYKAAQDELDRTSSIWKKEVDAKFAEVDILYKIYEAGDPLLSEARRKKMEDLLAARQKEALELQEKRFGKNGDLFKKRRELVEPLKNAIFEALH